MIAIDTNILVYAHRREMPFHSQALDRLKKLAQSRAPWGLPWPVVHEFLAVTTHARIFKTPTPLEEGIEFLSILQRSPGVHLLGEDAAYFSTLQKTLEESRVTGPRIHDARIAAICLHHHVRELWSADRDHSRFPGLRVVNPLIGDEKAASNA